MASHEFDQTIEAYEKYFSTAKAFQHSVEKFLPALTEMVEATQQLAAIKPDDPDPLGVFSSGNLAQLLGKVPYHAGVIDAPTPMSEKPTLRVVPSIIGDTIPRNSDQATRRTSPGYSKLLVYNTLPNDGTEGVTHERIVRDTGLQSAQVWNALYDLRKFGIVERLGDKRGSFRYTVKGDRQPYTQKDMSDIGGMTHNYRKKHTEDEGTSA